MAIGKFTLPICDGCRKPWLPDGWTPESDPRAYDAEQKAAGGRTLRCGKCKTSGWDREYSSEQRKNSSPSVVDMPKVPEEVFVFAAAVREHVEMIIGSLPDPIVQVSRCKHRLMHCPICNPQEAA